jgi:hypothetical protein
MGDFFTEFTPSSKQKLNEETNDQTEKKNKPPWRHGFLD